MKREEILDSIKASMKKMDKRHSPGSEPIEFPFMPLEMWEKKLSLMTDKELAALDKRGKEIVEEFK